MSDTSGQIPLVFKNTPVKTFKDFVLGKNRALIDSLESFSCSDETTFYLWGEAGCGKTHVLQALSYLLDTNNKTAVLIAPKDLLDRKNVSLIEMFDTICIDNTQNIASNTLLEEALFFWINEVKQARKRIILAGQISNKNTDWQLPDLRSRLQSGRTHELLPLERNEVLIVFSNLAQQKGLVIDTRVTAFLEKNCPMNLSFLSSLLSKLDEITLVEKKQVTIPLIKKILNTKLVK
ncbi:MAG: DnaA/Hda family protein [Proteobacteria bacterium]|nr:DnaA/Hda family protein [Pseudomonadota bacterium]